MNEPQLIRDDLKSLELNDPVADLLRDFEDEMYDLPVAGPLAGGYSITNKIVFVS